MKEQFVPCPVCGEMCHNGPLYCQCDEHGVFLTDEQKETMDKESYRHI